jgi:hypothetical protein
VKVFKNFEGGYIIMNVTLQDVLIHEAELSAVLDPPDVVNHPSHYTQGDIECIEAIEASMSKDAFKGYLKGNIMKYLWRYEQKGGLESLQKAEWYLKELLVANE